MRLEEFFVRYARGRGVTLAEEFARRLRRNLSTRTPLPPARAVPGAFPRRVTGRLRGSVRVVRTKNGARVVVFAPYAQHLEKTDHEFFARTLREMGLA